MCKEKPKRTDNCKLLRIYYLTGQFLVLLLREILSLKECIFISQQIVLTFYLLKILNLLELLQFLLPFLIFTKFTFWTRSGFESGSKIAPIMRIRADPNPV